MKIIDAILSLSSSTISNLFINHPISYISLPLIINIFSRQIQETLLTTSIKAPAVEINRPFT